MHMKSTAAQHPAIKNLCQLKRNSRGISKAHRTSLPKASFSKVKTIENIVKTSGYLQNNLTSFSPMFLMSLSTNRSEAATILQMT